jgi:uncharacterized protein
VSVWVSLDELFHEALPGRVVNVAAGGQRPRYNLVMSTMREQFKKVCRSHGVVLAYAFGSAAGDLDALLNGAAPGALAAMSDRDLGVVFSPRLGQLGVPAYQIYSRLAVDLDDLIPALDLVLLEETHSILQADAISGICVYSASDELRFDFEMDVLRRAADFRYHFEQYHRERREALG